MSYDIHLEDDDGATITLDSPHHLHGGTYQLGGCSEAWLNVTYNYSKHFRRVLGENGIRRIYGLSGQESIPVLESAIAQLEGDRDRDYWAATEGNAKAALSDLLELAKAAPAGIWNGD